MGISEVNYACRRHDRCCRPGESVHSSRNAVRTRPRARSHATSMKMPAIMPVASWARRSTNNRATSARRSRCDLRSSKPITALSVCACGVSPGHATSSTSPPSCRTSRRSPANSGSRLPTRWQQAQCERQSHQESDGGQKYPPNREDRRIKGTDRDPHAPHPLLYQRHRPTSDLGNPILL